MSGYVRAYHCRIGRADSPHGFCKHETDSVGTRNFNEYIEPPTGKNILGIQTRMNGGGQFRQDFTIDEFLEIHGTIQRANGSWYSPVVNWVTDRLTGDHHPVVIEIELEGFKDSDLTPYQMKN